MSVFVLLVFTGASGEGKKSSRHERVENNMQEANFNTAVNGLISVELPSTNLFGQPSVSPGCQVKEMRWEESGTTTTFGYNASHQLISVTESDGVEVNTTRIEYDANSRLSRVTNFGHVKAFEMAYDADNKISEVVVSTENRREKVSITYPGDKIVKAEHADHTLTYYFDQKYNLIKAFAQSRNAGDKTTIEAVIEGMAEYKNYLLSTGDFRFIPLLHGDYISEGAYANASMDYYKRYTTTENVGGVSKSRSYTTDVQSANANDFPTTVLIKPMNGEKDYRIHISYDCR